MGQCAAWALRSEWRTWTPLSGLVFGAAFETAASAGPLSALFLIATGLPALAGAVAIARRKLGVQRCRRRREDA